MKLKIKEFLVIFVSLTLSCGHPARDRAGIERAMQNYNRHIISMNLDSISSSYSEDGELGNIAKGRDSIRIFLTKFASFKVLSQLSTTDSIVINQDTAVQKGMYRQTVIVPVNDTVSVKGLFTARWIWQDGEWEIKHLETIPIK
ncbi:MAG: nuclear transport factor 2 family protein [Ferruginibacter sp.]